MPRERVCIDETGKTVDVLTILIYCVYYMLDSLMERINKKTIGKIQLEDINLILTLPDICDNTAKILLTEATQRVIRYYRPAIENVINLASHFLFILIIYI